MKLNPLVLLPGTLFWIFLVLALVTRIATVVTSRTNGSLNDHPYVELTLDLGGRTVEVRQVIAQIMVSQVQPGEEIAVKVDPLDPDVVVVDETLTPYGY